MLILAKELKLKRKKVIFLIKDTDQNGLRSIKKNFNVIQIPYRFNIKQEIGKTIFFDENTHFTFKNERLIDDKTLSHYKITNDNTIFVNKIMQINKDSKSMFKIVNGRCCGG